jgi:predicted aspartyl protease
MIQGWFGDEGALMFEIELITEEESELLEFPVHVILDTGFSGYLTINEQDLQLRGNQILKFMLVR